MNIPSLPPGHRILLYSDVDGTFLDHHTYSYADALNAYHELTDHSIRVIFCSSKTRAEIEDLMSHLPGRNPFIVENGAAIFIPNAFFPNFTNARIQGKYQIIELGLPYRQIMIHFHQIQQQFPDAVAGFSNMTDEALSLDAGLTRDQACRAKQREYSEAFKFINPNPDIQRQILAQIETSGLMCTQGGRYFHIHGRHNKGEAVKRVNALFKASLGPVMTIAIGDSINDLTMLLAVDMPVLVKKPDGSYDREICRQLPHIRKSHGVGPLGWTFIAREIIAMGSRL